MTVDGFKWNINSGFLGERHVCDFPLTHLNPVGTLEFVLRYVMNHLKLTEQPHIASTLNPGASHIVTAHKNVDKTSMNAVFFIRSGLELSCRPSFHTVSNSNQRLAYKNGH